MLDNPVWNSLRGPHQRFAIGAGSACRFPDDILAFVAIDPKSPSWPADLTSLIAPGEEVILLGAFDPSRLASFQCEKISIADQMVFDGSAVPEFDSDSIVEIESGEELVILTLVART